MDVTVSGSLARSCRIACLVLASLSCCAANSGAERSVTLRILDAKSGNPIRGASASVLTWKKDGQVEILAQGTTNKDGLIVFNVSEPLPERLGFDFSPNDLKYCSELAFPTDQILSVGLVAENRCKVQETNSVFARKPGEITIFADKFSWWERLRREL